MSFNNGELLNYSSNPLAFSQTFAKYSFGNGRLSEEAYHIIIANQDFKKTEESAHRKGANFKA